MEDSAPVATLKATKSMLGFEDGSSSGSSSEDGKSEGTASKVGESLFSFKGLLNIQINEVGLEFLSKKTVRYQVLFISL